MFDKYSTYMGEVGKSKSGSACSLTSMQGGFLPGDGSWHGLHALNGIPSQALVSVGLLGPPSSVQR